jgi:hypothetical protein
VWRSDIIKFASAQTDENGRFSTMFSLSSIVDTVYIKINSIDFPLPVMVAINSGSVSQTISSGATSPLKSASASVSPWKYEVSPFNSGSNLWSLGNFSNIGYPDYIESREAVNYNMKYSINTALPEKKNQIKTNPDLFTNPNSGNLKTQDKCQIWVTFLAEGAWWQNTLGYFYYPTNNAPASVAAITKQVVVFPNASTPYGFQSGDSGNGNMVQGDKVRLNYYNEETKQWTDTFPAGLTISWVLYPAGFRNGMGGNKGIIPTWNPIYSIASFNTNKQQQNVLLYDKVTENFIIGFEDTEREVISPSSDLDFNDVLIYATANPVSAIDKRDG